MRILLIEDEKDTAQILKRNLDNYFTVEVAYSGEEGEYLASVNDYDLIILDLMLPDMNGMEVTRKLRDNKIFTPILVLTAQFETESKIKALDLGADDYLTKPFSIEELLARIRALLRRPPQVLTSNIISVGDLIIDLNKRLVMRSGKTLFLRRKEFYLLEYLARNVGRVITRSMILDHVWESSNESLTNIVDVHIKYLRDQIDKPFNTKLIKTVHGMGYKIES